MEIAPRAEECALAVLPDGVPHLDLEAGAHHVVLGHVHEAHRLRQQNLELLHDPDLKRQRGSLRVFPSEEWQTYPSPSGRYAVERPLQIGCGAALGVTCRRKR